MDNVFNRRSFLSASIAGLLVGGLGKSVLASEADHPRATDNMVFNGKVSIGTVPTETYPWYNGIDGDLLQIGDGSKASPSKSYYSTLFVEKWAAFDNIPGTSYHVKGAGRFHTTKVSGASNVDNLISTILRTGGTGDCIALHARGMSNMPLSGSGQSGGSLYGIWTSVRNSLAASAGHGHLCGMEVDMIEQGGDAGHYTELGKKTNKNLSTALWLSACDTAYNNTYECTAAIGIYGDDKRGRPNFKGWHTGLLVCSQSIIQEDSGKNEAVLVQGASTLPESYVALRGTRHLYRGVEFSNAVFNDNIAMQLGSDHCISWAAAPLNSSLHQLELYRNGKDIGLLVHEAGGANKAFINLRRGNRDCELVHDDRGFKIGSASLEPFRISFDPADRASAFVLMSAPSVPPSDMTLQKSQWCLWINEHNNTINLKAKKADGTVISHVIGA